MQASRSTADAAIMLQAWESLTLHAHDAHAAGQAIHMQAAPSQAEALMHEFKAKKAAAAHRSKASACWHPIPAHAGQGGHCHVCWCSTGCMQQCSGACPFCRTTRCQRSAAVGSGGKTLCPQHMLTTLIWLQAAVLEAYGSAAAAKPEDIAQLGQSEGYVEYNAQGRVIKGHAQPVSLLLPGCRLVWLSAALGGSMQAAAAASRLARQLPSKAAWGVWLLTRWVLADKGSKTCCLCPPGRTLLALELLKLFCWPLDLQPSAGPSEASVLTAGPILVPDLCLWHAGAHAV